MKKKSLILLVFAAFRGHAQVFDWTVQLGEGGSDASHAITTDNEGNVFVSGYFESAKMKLGSVSLVNKKAETMDIFVAKYDPAGKLLWARSAGGESDDRAEAICTDAKGNCYITGHFKSKEVTFDSQKISSNTDNRASDEFYIAKYSASGTLLWVKSVKSTFSETNSGKTLCVDPAGNVIVSGGFQSERITFGSFTLTNTMKGKGDVYLVKYNPNGDVIWAKSAGGRGYDLGTSLASSADGSIYLGGFFNESIVFGKDTLHTTGDADAYLAKFDSKGNPLWAREYGGTKFEGIMGLAIDKQQNILIAGNSSSTDMRLGLRNIAQKGRTSVFVCKITPEGEISWSKNSVQSDGYVQANSLAVDAAGNCIVYGDYKGQEMGFGKLTLPVASPNTHFYLVKFDGKTGDELKNAHLNLGFDYNSIGWMCIDRQDNISITGSFMEKELKIDKRTLQNHGSFDMFVSRLKL